MVKFQPRQLLRVNIINIIVVKRRFFPIPSPLLSFSFSLYSLFAHSVYLLSVTHISASHFSNHPHIFSGKRKCRPERSIEFDSTSHLRWRLEHRRKAFSWKFLIWFDGNVKTGPCSSLSSLLVVVMVILALFQEARLKNSRNFCARVLSFRELLQSSQFAANYILIWYINCCIVKNVR